MLVKRWGERRLGGGPRARREGAEVEEGGRGAEVEEGERGRLWGGGARGLGREAPVATAQSLPFVNDTKEEDDLSQNQPLR
jgi:hypothetical protein